MGGGIARHIAKHLWRHHPGRFATPEEAELVGEQALGEHHLGGPKQRRGKDQRLAGAESDGAELAGEPRLAGEVEVRPQRRAGRQGEVEQAADEEVQRRQQQRQVAVEGVGAARADQQDRLSLLQQHAAAHAELARTQPLQDAAFIADRFHGGRLTYSVAERSDWQTMPKRIVRAFDSRTNIVTIAVAPHAGAELDGRPV